MRIAPCPDLYSKLHKLHRLVDLSARHWLRASTLPMHTTVREQAHTGKSVCLYGTSKHNLIGCCGEWKAQALAGCGCRDARQHNETEGPEAAARHDAGQAKAEPVDDTPAHSSRQVSSCTTGLFCRLPMHSSFCEANSSACWVHYTLQQ